MALHEVTLESGACLCTQSRHREGSSFTWRQPCSNQVSKRHFPSDFETRFKKSYCHSFRTTCDKSAGCLLESREQRYIKAINNMFQSHLSLSDRYQSTSVNNSSSSPSQLMYGVPQGSVLGPVLFVLYTTPLSAIIANHSVNHQLFADDTQLQKSAPLREVTSLTKELNACTDDIKTGWRKIGSN